MFTLPASASRAVPRASAGWRGCLTGPGLACLTLLVLGSAGPLAADQAIRADYRCLGRFDASDVTAFFFNAEPAQVVLLEGEQAQRLPRALAASGSRYSDGRDTFWIKGDQATWSQGRAPARRCIARP